MTAAGEDPPVFAAPGKLMIAGEYSVLGSGPTAIALAVAVEPGVCASTSQSDVWRLAREDGPAWEEGAPVPEGLRFAHAAWCVLRPALDARQTAPQRIVTRGSNLVWEPASGKRGVGGSASATVAVTAVLSTLAGIDPVRERHAVLHSALQAHRQAQAGRGSGYDVGTGSGSSAWSLQRWRR